MRRPGDRRGAGWAASLVVTLSVMLAACSATTGPRGDGPLDVVPVIDVQPQPQVVTEGQPALLRGRGRHRAPLLTSGSGTGPPSPAPLFGKYGVFAATAWLNRRPTSSYRVVDRTRDYAGVAFDAFRNYDGAGATVGDLAVRATASDDRGTSVYAFAHAGDASRLELVALNKTPRASRCA